MLGEEPKEFYEMELVTGNDLDVLGVFDLFSQDEWVEMFRGLELMEPHRVNVSRFVLCGCKRSSKSGEGVPYR